MKVYTTKDVAALLLVDEKTVLRLCHRKLLTPIPGIRHKRFTEEEVKRYMNAR
jgi:excisionase family DNA binding protein